MKRIFVVCGAGASSTFLAHWMRSAAARRSEQVTVTPSSLTDLHARLTQGDVVLVGHHLESRLNEIAAIAGGVDAAVALLPSLSIDATGAETALGVARSLTPATEPETSKHHREPEDIHG